MRANLSSPKSNLAAVGDHIVTNLMVQMATLLLPVSPLLSGFSCQRRCDAK